MKQTKSKEQQPAAPAAAPKRRRHFSFHQLLVSWKNVSIKWRIFSVFVVFTIVVLAVLWLFQTVLFDNFYESTKRRELQRATDTIQKNLYNPQLNDVIEQTARNGQIYAVGVRSDGTVIFSSDFSPNRFSGFISEHLLQILQTTINEGGSHYEVISGRNSKLANGDRELVYATVKNDSGGNTYMIFLYTILTPMDATINTIRTQFVWLTLILLGTGALLALYLSRHISRPIIKITGTAQELATGDYDVTFNEQGYREIAQLGHTLNYAAHELGKVEHLQRDLVANISHDLRTPLTMISGYAEIMRDLPGENTPENVQIIIDEANRLTSLVNDTLDLSKLQSGTQKVEKTEFDLTETIRHILHRYDKMTDYVLTFDADREVLVYADELKISQVVYNLINNAITYTGKDRRVMLRQVIDGQQVKIEVTDTGEGIPEDKLKDIWKRYYKVDKEHKRAQIGTGLGLSIVKTILDMHDGTYGVRSAVGKGSTFWFSLTIRQQLPLSKPQKRLPEQQEQTKAEEDQKK
ncbi:MAG: HAMP domain-containing histidine kinase [Oscillospiraceae bacterium]|nr:HAMP domain-containing histidine kinase [Oscillospiraceae bacterium]